MSSKARGLADLGNAFNDGALSNRNKIINGGFQVAQRGTSGTTTSSGYISVDRWRAYISGNSTVTLSQQVFTPGQTDVPGNPEYFMRYDWLGTNPALTKIVMQRIENVKSLVGTVTLSFYARTELGDDVDVEVYQNFGSGGSTEVTALDQTINCTSSWQKFTITFDLPSLSGKTIGASSYIEVSWRSAEGTNSYLDIAQVQLEAGDTATPFEHRSYGQELALCQRYCQVFTGTDNVRAALSGNGGNTSYPTLLFVTEMRASPTGVISSPSHFYVEGLNGGKPTPSSIGLNVASKHSATFTCVSSGITGGGTNLLFQGSSGKITLSAEL